MQKRWMFSFRLKFLQWSEWDLCACVLKSSSIRAIKFGVTARINWHDLLNTFFFVCIDKSSLFNIRFCIVIGIPVVHPGACWSFVGEVFVRDDFISRDSAHEVQSFNVSNLTCLYAALIITIHGINTRVIELFVYACIVHHVCVAINVHKADGIDNAYSIFDLEGYCIRLGELLTSIQKL